MHCCSSRVCMRKSGGKHGGLFLRVYHRGLNHPSSYQGIIWEYCFHAGNRGYALFWPHCAIIVKHLRWSPSPNLLGNHPTTVWRSNLRTHLPDAHTQSLGPDGFVESFMMTFRFNFRIIKIYCTWICESESTIGEIDNQLQNFINSLMFQPLILSSFSSFLYPPPPSPFPAFLYPLKLPLQRSQQQLALFDFPLKK